MNDDPREQRQADIDLQMSLLNIHRLNLAHLSAQLRDLGLYAAPHVRSEVALRVQAIARIKAVLRGMGQQVDDLPGDG